MPLYMCFYLPFGVYVASSFDKMYFNVSEFISLQYFVAITNVESSELIMLNQK